MTLLNGVSVVAFTNAIAGPICTQILADLGAEVTNIERPVFGDQARSWPVTFRGINLDFENLNRNKKSVTLNLKSRRGRELALEIIKRSDILVENFSPSAMIGYGLGYSRVRKFNPRLIYCSISGYGHEGPYKDKLGTDLILQAESGMMYVNRRKNGVPNRLIPPMPDLVSGMVAALSIIAVLADQAASKKGEYIDISILDTAAYLMATYNLAHFLNSTEPTPLSNVEHPYLTPNEGFCVKDGKWIVLAAYGSNWPKFCKLMRLEQLIADTRFSDNERRLANRSDLRRILSRKFKEKTSSEWYELLGDQIPCGIVNDLQGAFNHPQLAYRKVLQNVSHERAGKIQLFPFPARFKNHSLRKARRAPLLGEHTREVLERLGYSVEDIETFRRANVT